ESRIPVDAETERCLAEAGYGLDDVLPADEELVVRKAANLHLGGTIHDVTAEVHPTLVQAAVDAARAIDIPVTGIDLMVRAPDQPDYAFIEPTSAPAWPITNRSRRPNGSSTCCFP